VADRPDARIQPLTPEEAARAASDVQLDIGWSKSNLFRVLLQHPRLAKNTRDFLTTLLYRGNLDNRIRELVIMRVAWTTGSAYEWASHWDIARRLEIPEDDLIAIQSWEQYPRFGGAERAALACADAMVETGQISERLWAHCASQFDSQSDLLELVFTVGLWRMISTVLRSLEIPLESGLIPWAPTKGPS
jgi:alkylhydroperoxidase family enzyme